jgi:hypothetical protein
VLLVLVALLATLSRLLLLLLTRLLIVLAALVLLAALVWITHVWSPSLGLWNLRAGQLPADDAGSIWCGLYLGKRRLP